MAEPARLGCRDCLEIDPVEQSGPAVPAAHGYRQIDARIGRHAHDCGEAFGVGRGKALPPRRGGRVDNDSVAERLEPFGRAQDRCGLERKSGRRIQADAVSRTLHPRTS
jgi:hypothetical protein